MNELEKAKKAAEAAQKALAEAEAKEAARQAEIAAKRAEREKEYAASFLSGWRERAGKVGESDPKTEYDPNTMGFLEDVIRAVTKREMRRVVVDEAQRSERILSVPSNQSTVPEVRHYAFNAVDYIGKIIDQEAARRAGEFAAELEAEREKFVNGS
ncbi:hypothetical protein OG350_09725 [Streptomyces achromogenes]|uniref:Uncharacterized protein n=1 Tax=Streptomyces achromogenes TaxID=67255 RepID=A0ABZ1KMQ8_STRAH